MANLTNSAKQRRLNPNKKELFQNNSEITLHNIKLRGLRLKKRQSMQVFFKLNAKSYIMKFRNSNKYQVTHCDTVSALGREEGYTMKYSLSIREIPRAEPKGFPECDFSSVIFGGVVGGQHCIYK